MKKRTSEVAKPASKNLKKAAKKELESGITLRFLEAVNNLGHDAERIAKDIKKMSKQIAEKLSEQLKKSKKEDDKKKNKKGAKDKKVADKKEVKTSADPVKSITRAKKVVAKVAKTSAPKEEPKPVVENIVADTPQKEPVRRGRRPSKAAEETPVRRTRTRKPVQEADAKAVPKPRGRRRKADAGTEATDQTSQGNTEKMTAVAQTNTESEREE